MLDRLKDMKVLCVCLSAGVPKEFGSIADLRGEPACSFVPLGDILTGMQRDHCGPPPHTFFLAAPSESTVGSPVVAGPRRRAGSADP